MDLTSTKYFEGFRPTTYWDVNHHRTGYGSDTITLPDGSVQTVRPGVRVTRADAERDLARRSALGARMMHAQIGDAWNRYNPVQQGQLYSVYHNYGRLPTNVIKAAQTGNVDATAAAIAALAPHNKGINAKRRQTEANIFRTGQLPSDIGSAVAKATGVNQGPINYATTGSSLSNSATSTQIAQVQQQTDQQAQQQAQQEPEQQTQSMFSPQVAQVDLPLTGNDTELLQNLTQFKPSTPDTTKDVTQGITQNAFKFSVQTPTGQQTAMASTPRDYSALSQIAESGYTPEQQDGLRNMYAALAPAADRESGQSLFGGPQLPSELEKVIDGLMSA